MLRVYHLCDSIYVIEEVREERSREKVVEISGKEKKGIAVRDGEKKRE